MIPAVGPEAGAVVMFIIAAIATSLLVFSAMSRPKYRRSDNTIVEEFKEWKDTNNQNRQLYRSVVSAMWPLIVVIYLILSFVFGSWAYSWIIFLIGVALQHIIKLVFEMRK
jgi:multidrug efflux pump subunit AcrB